MLNVLDKKGADHVFIVYLELVYCEFRRDLADLKKDLPRESELGG